MNEDKLKKVLSLLPSNPGVYLMKNSNGKVIYIGKSVCLKNRVRSYFNTRKNDVKTQAMVASIEDIELIVTDNEVEALILENNLIKKHKPRYNVLLKDSKTHPYIKVTVKDEYPRIEKVRKVKFKDGNLYFGPFPNSGDLNVIVDMLSKKFRLCNSAKAIKSDKQRPCLRYHLNACMGACMRKVSPENYLENVNEAIKVLSGKRKPEFSDMKKQIQCLTNEFRYEEAAEIRDMVLALKRFFITQKVEFLVSVNADIWGSCQVADRIVFSNFFIRAGKLLGNRVIQVEREPATDIEKVFANVITQFYESNIIPSDIYSSILPDGSEAIKIVLSNRAQKKVSIKTAEKGRYKKLQAMADDNAFEVIKNVQADERKDPHKAVVELKKRLQLKTMPLTIECIDISHIQGTDTVASLVVFNNNQPQKKSYRLFHIKKATQGDDPAAIAEVVARRFSRLIIENQKMPDLLIVDGGIAQVKAAKKELDNLNICIEVFGIAKKEEVIIAPNNEQFCLPLSSTAMKMIIKLRNEAHRFANSFHAKTRSKRMTRSALMNLPGVGPATLKKVVGQFGSIKNILTIKPDELAQKASIPQKTAEMIVQYVKQSSS